MNFELTSIGQLKYCPSVIEIIDESRDSYVIGCYQLVGEGEDVGLSDDQLASINQRLGCLVYIDSSVIKAEFDCPDGGVFDLKVIQSIKGQMEDNPKWWTAHSNGTIGYYSLINETIVLNQRIVTGSSMLCSLTVCDPTSGLLLVGDSQSKVIAAKVDKVIGQCKVTTNSSDDPVWCLKSVQLDTSTFLILSGSEDSRLRINLLQSGSFSITIKTIKDFTAGVTSIAVVENPDRGDDDDDQNQNLDYIVYVGSYDETIRVYRLTISIGGEQEKLITQESIKLLGIQSININGSGIWKLIPIKSEGKWPYLLTASMYAGAHILQQQSILTAIKIDTSLDVDDKNCPTDHLVYGVSGTINCNQIIVTSFYGKTFHLFRRCF